MKRELTSPQNPKIKETLALRDRRDRDQTSLFLIEGYRELKRAAEGGITIRRLFVSEEFFLGSNEPELIHQITSLGAEIFYCPAHIFEKLSYRDRPDGLLGVAVQMKYSLPELLATLHASPLLLVAEAIEKPGNLGTMLRSADAAGVNGVIVCDRCTDIYNPNVVRASVGTLFTQPVVEAGGAETLLRLQEKKIQVVAATPSATQEFTEVDLTGPIAIVVGTEQLGLSDAWMQSADIKVRIPMHGKADSLNVAVATTLMLYEAVRQRRGAWR
jgi:RNA methyltransferase, TrmH family